MREGLRSSSSREVEKVDSGDDVGELEGVKVPDLNVNGDPDVILSGEEGKCCSEVSKINGKSNDSFCGGGLDEEECKGMEVELEGVKSGFQSVKCSKVDDCERKEMRGGLDDRMGDVDGNVRNCLVVTVNGEEKFCDCSGTLGGDTGMGGEGTATGVEGVNCAVGAVDQVITSSSGALEHVDKDPSLEEVKEKNSQRNDDIDDKDSCPQGVEIDTVQSDSGAAVGGEEKVVGTEISDCEFDKDGKGESLNMEAEQGTVEVVGKVLRSRIVPANGDVSGGGQFKAVQVKRKRGTDSPGGGAVTAQEESEKSAFNSGRVRKRGRPKKSIDLSEEVFLINKVLVDSEAEDGDVNRKPVKTRKKKGKRGRPKKSIDLPEEEVLQLNNVPFLLEDEDKRLDNNKVLFFAGAADEGVKRKSDKNRKKKGKRGRPKKSVDHPEEEVLQLNNVPFISEEVDENLNKKALGTPEQKGKRGRPKKFIDSPEGNVVQMNKPHALSDVAEKDLNSKSVRNSKKKGKRGRPRKSLDCPDGEVDCDDDHEAGNVSKKYVGNSEPDPRRGRPRKFVSYAEEEVVEVKKVSFQEVNSESESANEELSKKSVRTSKKKRKRGRPKKGGNSALKMTFHDKGKVKNVTKMKVSLVAAPVRRSRRDIHPGKMQKARTNGVFGLKGVVSDRKISSSGREANVVHSSSKVQEKMLTKDNMSKKRKRVEKAGSLSAEKNSIRNQIVNMLLAAGWTVEYRPRQGREYSDAVYVNQEGKTHWSVTKAYFTLKQEFEEGKLVSGAATSKFSFTAVPEEILRKLFRVVSKTRSDKNKRKKSDGADNGDRKHCMKRKPAIRSGSQNKRRCALQVRRSKNSESDGIVAHSGKHSVLAWMIDSGTIPLNGKVYYMNRRKTRAMLEGSITRDGIHCYCCKEVISVAEFEKHAGSKLCEPYENMYLESGPSLLQCQLDAWNKQEEIGRSGFHTVPVDGDDPNDDTCGICGDGGELVCCDGCPSTFHHDCLDVEEVPSGEWHCVYCSCKYCGGVSEAESESDDDCEHLSSSLVSCSLCQEKYHPSCINDEDVCTESKQPTFCGRNCEQIFVGLHSLVGTKRDLGDGFSCTLLHRSDVQEDISTWQPQKILSNSKLAVALSIMDECFLPILDHRSGINLIRHIVYSCGSNFKRLNFSSFFTVVLEKGDEVISAASIRIRGKHLSEMPFIGTRNVYRRQGMCRRLLNAIEVALASLDVENLVIPAIPELMQTWTLVFGFKPLEENVEEEMRALSMLVFPHTDMLQKPLSKQQLVRKSITTTEDDLKCVESGNAEHTDGGADKSEVDDGCLNGTFDLNSAASTFPESSPDKDDIVHPENKVEVQPEEAPLMDPTEARAPKPDLNLMVESLDEDGANPNSLKSSSDEKGLPHLVFATSNSDQVPKSTTDSLSLTHANMQSILENGHQDTGSPPIKSSREERTHDFDLNLMEENIPEYSKLPSDLVGH